MLLSTEHLKFDAESSYQLDRFMCLPRSRASNGICFNGSSRHAVAWQWLQRKRFPNVQSYEPLSLMLAGVHLRNDRKRSVLKVNGRLLFDASLRNVNSARLFEERREASFDKFMLSLNDMLLSLHSISQESQNLSRKAWKVWRFRLVLGIRNYSLSCNKDLTKAG